VASLLYWQPKTLKDLFLSWSWSLSTPVILLFSLLVFKHWFLMMFRCHIHCETPEITRCFTFGGNIKSCTSAAWCCFCGKNKVKRKLWTKSDTGWSDYSPWLLWVFLFIIQLQVDSVCPLTLHSDPTCYVQRKLRCSLFPQCLWTADGRGGQ